MKWTPVANFMKLVEQNLLRYWHIALSFDSVYATKGLPQGGIIYAKKYL